MKARSIRAGSNPARSRGAMPERKRLFSIDPFPKYLRGSGGIEQRNCAYPP